MSIEEILARLAEDRVIAERERRQYRIKEAFEAARQADLPVPKAATPATVAPVPPKPIRPLLTTLAAPVLRVCERRFDAAAAARDYKECYEIVRPLKDAHQLIAEALEDVQQLPSQPRAKRYEVEDQ